MESTNFSLIDLPLHVLINILNKLSISDLKNVMLTCQTLRHMVKNNNGVWRLICQEQFLVLNISTSNTHHDRMKSISGYNQCRLSHNWKKGFFRNKITLQHNINYMPWLRLHSQCLILSFGSELHCYGSDKKGIPNGSDLRWRLEVPKIMRGDVRTNDISRFLVKKNNIVCGNRDGCVSVYNLKNINHRPKLDDHIQNCHLDGQLEVSDVEITSKSETACILTVSDDSPVLKFWKPSNINYNERVRRKSERDVKIEECVGIRCLCLDGSEGKLAMGPNGNRKPFLLDVETGNMLLSIEGHKDPRGVVRDIQWHDCNTVTYVTHSGMLQSIDIRTSQTVFKAMDPFQSTLYCVRTDGCRAILVGSAEYSRCVLFDVRRESKHVQMYFTQRKSSPVYSLDFDSWKLVTAADRSVATLDFNVSIATTAQRDYSHVFEHVNT